MRRSTAIALLSLLASAFVAMSAYAGGPFAVDTMNDSGTALKWKNSTFEWYLDPGPLSSGIDNATGKQWVDDALQKWTTVTLRNKDAQNVGTAALNVSCKGKISEDVNGSNYGPYVSTTSGVSAVIFDDNGDIVAKMLGEENRGGVVGLSAPLLSDSSGLYITKGFSLFNGSVLASGGLAKDTSTANELFQASMLHELGHVVNLDHSQVNDGIASTCANSGNIYDRNGSCENGQYIPTMYPELLCTLQNNLTRDDKITISGIYPNKVFETSFCTITGEIFDANGDPLKGVNVIASRAGEGDNMARIDSRSFVSGAMTGDCSGSSAYFLRGITPGVSYQVTYEELNEKYRNYSGFEPLPNPPSGFESGTISDTNGNTTVKCENGGETIQMASVTISTQNPCKGGTGTGTGGAGSSTSGNQSQASGGGCSLSGAVGAGLPLSPLYAIVFASLAIFTARKAYRKS